MTTFKTIVIKSHQQTMDEFAAICDATIKREKVEQEESHTASPALKRFARP
jgi:hypothetical protein